MGIQHQTHSDLTTGLPNDLVTFLSLMNFWQIDFYDSLALIGLQEPDFNSNLVDYMEQGLPLPVRRKLFWFEKMHAALMLMSDTHMFDHDWLDRPIHDLCGNTPRENMLFFGTGGIQLVSNYLIHQQVNQHLCAYSQRNPEHRHMMPMEGSDQ